jgi:hypothetical protein
LQSHWITTCRRLDFVDGTAIATGEAMRIDLDAALRELEEEEPKVIVEPEIGAFCVVRPSGAASPATPATTVPERTPLEVILAYLAKTS